LLRGLRDFATASLPWAPRPVDITAVVTVTDDGGSSGRLRREFDVLPPGDIRNCMVALSEDEALLSKLLQYRFPSGKGLKGHSFGNLLLTALTNVTGDFIKAVRFCSEVLAISGKIYPATSINVTLEATLADGSKVTGETNISRSRSRIVRLALKPSDCRPLPETLAAIAQADLITIGPGSLFTSLIPNLLVKGIPEAIRRSPAIKACVINLMTQPGETTNFTASDHVQAILDHSYPDLLDFAIVNTTPIQPALRRKYARQKAKPVEVDTARLEELGLAVVRAPLAEQGEKVRHDPAALAGTVLDLAALGRTRAGRSAK